MGYKEGVMTRSVQMVIRFTPEEARHIREIVKANSGTVSEFVRTCVNTALAQQGDPEATQMLITMFDKGMRDVVEKRVQAELARRKKRA